MDSAYDWICRLRKDYSANSDVWNFRRDWEHIREEMLNQLNDGSYQFGVIDRLEFPDATLSLWSSRDMVALKLISIALGQKMGKYIPKSCCQVKGHGGLKKAVRETYEALPKYQYVMRSDVQGYYASICHDTLMGIIQSYVTHPILLTLVRKACMRTETTGGHFFDFHKQGLPKGSPLSPILAAAALIPLDRAIGNMNGVFYRRFVDDWVVLAKSKSALRKVVRRTHAIMRELKLRLHPRKTFIGKIKRGFNFLGYYMDHQKILPSTETIRRFHERATALLYEPSQANRNVSRRYRKQNATGRDISEYQTNEAPPTDAYFQNILARLLSLASRTADTFAIMRKYVNKWARWLTLGMSSIQAFETSVQTHLPGLLSHLSPA